MSRTEEHLNPRIPRVRVFSNAGDLAREGAKIFLGRLRKLVLSQGKASVILSGGSSPRELYEETGSLLSSWPVEQRSRILWIPGDERMVPPGHPESNVRMIRESLFRSSDLPEDMFDRIRGEASSPEEEALRFEHVILDRFETPGLHVPEFDWAFLGVGLDGHTASLFPGSDPALEHRRLVLAVPPEGDRLPRITLGYRLLSHARTVVFLCPGEQKKKVLKDILIDLKPCPVQELLTLCLDNGRIPEFWMDESAYDPGLDRHVIS
ncbi:MAG: 6-phosphogluconolactonase [Leptospirales bacterium]